MIESGLVSTIIFLAKVTLKISQEKYFLLILCCKLIDGHIKLKIQTQEIIESFYEKELLSKL